MKEDRTTRTRSEQVAPPESSPPVTGKDVLLARPGFLVRRLHQIHVSMFLEEFKSENITPVQYGVLTAIGATPGLDQTALSQEVGLDRTTTADVVRRLEERGLVERSPSAEDRRARHVWLTAEGEKLVRDMHAAMARAQERLLAPLRPAERAMLMDLMRILVDANNENGRTVLRTI